MQLLLKATAATLNLAKKLAKLFVAYLDDDDAPTGILLYGEMGSGKTTFVRGFVSALENASLAEIASPSFSYVNIYPTKPQILHADLFRVGTDDPVRPYILPEDLEETLFNTPKALVIIEWAEKLPPKYLPNNRLDIIIKICNNRRSFLLEPYGRIALEIVEKLRK